MSDRIIVDVDDSAIDAAIAKLQMAMTLSQTSLGTTNIVKGTQQTQKATQQLQFTLRPVTNQMAVMKYRLAQLGLKDLPGLNREMRVILGTIPGMREAMWAYFGFKREYTAIGRVVAGGMTGPAAIGLVLATVTTLILIVRAIENNIRKMQQKQRERDRWVRGVMGMSRDEYKRQLKLWEHYARSNPG